MMDLRNARRILGMEIVRNIEDHALFLSQKGYLEKVLKRVTHVCNGVFMIRYCSFRLKFGSSKEGVGIIGYVDFDYAGDLDKRRSTTGYIFILFGGPVSLKSQLQSIAALSTTEAEYIVATEAMKEPLWLQGLVKELGVNVRYHFIRETVSLGAAKLEKISTPDNPANMATKVLLWIFGGDLDPWM
ncbi:Retrovirus-related Pol polyprotein from transposon TNT 1-94 [Vitis vinifera]|uniref:Retrovirus-related Pol polyprotein from transposon TNT 1-94 n=1 Tax=Vitis vinifera TaxID=29760 RepID=A0A438FUY4_VITVI|nr:Retrovirus-related Pol polyprotein from transposon TNT 1-94 [Vitis vinifera]